jgi:hypothetical protein
LLGGADPSVQDEPTLSLSHNSLFSLSDGGSVCKTNLSSVPLARLKRQRHSNHRSSEQERPVALDLDAHSK